MRSHGKASTAIVIALALALIPAASAKADVFLANSPAFFTTADNQMPSGISVNPGSNDVYVAQLLNGGFTPGTVGRYSAAGAPLAASFSGIVPQGVAVAPASGKVWEFNPDLFEIAGGPHLRSYDATGGEASAPISVGTEGGPIQIATDAAGNVYYPNTALDVVQKFDSSGVLQATTFPATGTVPDPKVAAVDSDGDVYVLDTTDGGRVQRFDASGENPTTFASANPSGTIESVAVHPVNDEVYVYRADEFINRVSAYTEDGTQFGGFTSSEFGPGFAPFASHQIAVNPNSGMVYVTSADFSARVFMFKRVFSPIVTTEGFEGVTQTTATVQGTVNPNSSPTACEFEYGETLAYELSEQCSFVPGGGSETLEVDAKLSELKPGTTYHYRARAVNAGGVTAGADATFTTAPAPPSGESAPSTPAATSSPPASTPPPVVSPPKPKTVKCRKGFRRVKVRGKTRCKKVVRRSAKRTQSANRGGSK